jgi:hypothetical protein
MASLQGGLLLTQVRRDPNQLRIALNAARDNLRVAEADGGERQLPGRESHPQRPHFRKSCATTDSMARGRKLVDANLVSLATKPGVCRNKPIVGLM